MMTTPRSRVVVGNFKYRGKAHGRPKYVWRPLSRAQISACVYPNIVPAEYPHVENWETRSDVLGYSSLPERDEDCLDFKHGDGDVCHIADHKSPVLPPAATFCCGCRYPACLSCYSSMGQYTHNPIPIVSATDLDSILLEPSDFIVRDEVVINIGDEPNQSSAPPPSDPIVPMEMKDKEVKAGPSEDTKIKTSGGVSNVKLNTSIPPSVDPMASRLIALIGTEEDKELADIKSLPVPPHELPPEAPVIENLPAMEAELAAMILRNKLRSGMHEDEKKVDPPIHLEALPDQFKVRRDVPWFKKMIHCLFGCCTDQIATTRHYTLEGKMLADFHINGLDSRATNALSHTMLRQEPQIVRISVVPYDQFDNQMPVFDLHPVTWKKGEDVGRSIIHVPLVLVADMMRKFMAVDVSVNDLRMMYQDLVKVINVPYNEFMSSEPDFVMFGLDLMQWMKQRRQASGLQNFHSARST